MHAQDCARYRATTNGTGPKTVGCDAYTWRLTTKSAFRGVNAIRWSKCKQFNNTVQCSCNVCRSLHEHPTRTLVFPVADTRETRATSRSHLRFTVKYRVLFVLTVAKERYMKMAAFGERF